jgi:hypothetical protein
MRLGKRNGRRVGSVPRARDEEGKTESGQAESLHNPALMKMNMAQKSSTTERVVT